MKHYFQNSKTKGILVFLITLILLFNACNSSKHVTKNRDVNWEVDLEENTSEQDKIQAESAIQKYIINFYYSQNKGIILKKIDFTLTDVSKNKFAIIANVEIGTSIGQSAEPTKIHIPVPPKDVIKNIFSLITNIQDR